MAGAADAVVVDGERLCVSQRPPPLSRVVRAAEARLLAELDLPRLVSQLAAVGADLHAAHAATAAFHDLQVLVQRAGFGLAKLADRSAAELEAFRHAAGKVLDDLECVHELLLAGGLEDAALAALRGSNVESARLAREARSLADDFHAAADDAQRTLRRTVDRRADQERRRAALAADVAEYRLQLEAARETKEASETAFEDAHALYEDAVRREQHAGLKNGAMQIAQAATAVGSLVSARPSLHLVGLGGMTALASAFEAEVVRVREEKAVYLHERHKQRMSRLDAAKAVAELTARLRLARDEDQVAGEAVQRLEDAVAGLRVLAGVMLKAEVFWAAVQTNLGRSDAAALEHAIEGSTALVPEKRTDLWAADGFKKRAIAAYAPWVALQGVCVDYGEKLRGTRSALYGLLEDDVDGDDSKDCSEDGGDGRQLALLPAHPAALFGEKEDADGLRSRGPSV